MAASYGQRCQGCRSLCSTGSEGPERGASAGGESLECGSDASSAIQNLYENHVSLSLACATKRGPEPTNLRGSEATGLGTSEGPNPRGSEAPGRRGDELTKPRVSDSPR